MIYEYIIDSSAWVEYFSGSSKGNKIKEIIEESKVGTSIIAIVELADKFERENKNFENELDFIKSRATIISISINLALEAAKIKKEFRIKNSKFGIADAIHLATSKLESSKFVTSDNDFIHYNNVLLI